MHRLEWFTEFYFNRLRNHNMFVEMGRVFENSPWHREDNVRIHTDMVVAHYIANSEKSHFDLTLRRYDWSSDELLGALACAFHDVGKPAALTWAHSEERGDYKTFKGHELVSARMWENFYASHYSELSQIISPMDFWKVTWMIEHHLPYRITKPHKVDAMVQTLHRAFDDEMVFEQVLKADCWGRISDNHEAKKQDVLNWIDGFNEQRARIIPKTISTNRPVVSMLIGASGSGKSTYITNTNTSNVFSLDALRLKWYGNDYSLAFKASVEDSTFASRAQHEYVQMLKTKQDVAVDNTNTSAKRRRHYIEQARSNGYTVRAVVFPVQLDVVIGRQFTRGDKKVPEEAVCQQYMNLQMPSYGEFDEIEIVTTNLD